MITKPYNLTDICRPKQWPTIPMSSLTETGYPVYGANGKIGFYSEFTHAEPTLLITCRGATCGELNICEAFSYVTGNAMALDELDENVVNLYYLHFTLAKRGLNDTITGSAQPQITRESLSSVVVNLPPLDEQKRIAARLGKADRLRRLRRYALEVSEGYLQSLFLDMFGDPATNPMGWDITEIGEIAVGGRKGVNTGPFGTQLTSEDWSSEGPNVYGTYSITNEGTFVEESPKKIFDHSFKKLIRFSIQANDVIISRMGTVGRVCVIPENAPKGIISYHLIKVRPELTIVDPTYLKMFLIITANLGVGLQSSAKGAIMDGINADIVAREKILLPPLIKQEKFAAVAKRHERLRAQQREALRQAEHLFQTLLHQAFEIN